MQAPGLTNKLQNQTGIAVVSLNQRLLIAFEGILQTGVVEFLLYIPQLAVPTNQCNAVSQSGHILNYS